MSKENQYKLAECAMFETKLELAARLVQEVRNEANELDSVDRKMASRIKNDIDELRTTLKSYYKKYDKESSEMNYAELQDFCFSWYNDYAMDVDTEIDLKNRFAKKNWNFEQFQRQAKQYNLWSDSMKILSDLT